MLIGSDVDAHSGIDDDDGNDENDNGNDNDDNNDDNITMNKTAAALRSRERIDGIRRQVSRLSDHARLIRLSFGFASESES